MAQLAFWQGVNALILKVFLDNAAMKFLSLGLPAVGRRRIIAVVRQGRGVLKTRKFSESD